MADLPAVGTRVSLRYRRPAGSVPPLTDVIGHLIETGARLKVRTKTGAVVEIAPDDVVAVAHAVLRHRLQLRPEAELERYTEDDAVSAAISSVPVPR